MTVTELETLATAMTVLNDLAHRKEIPAWTAAQAVLAIGDILNKGGIVTEEHKANQDYAEKAT